MKYIYLYEINQGFQKLLIKNYQFIYKKNFNLQHKISPDLNYILRNQYYIIFPYYPYYPILSHIIFPFKQIQITSKYKIPTNTYTHATHTHTHARTRTTHSSTHPHKHTHKTHNAHAHYIKRKI